MKRVLLTGAGGYIGRHMLDGLLARDFEIHAVSRPGSRSGRHGSDNIIWHATDLLDVSAVETLLASIGATHLMHLAWVTEHGEFWQSPLNTDWLNASIALMECFKNHGGQRAVLAGTCAEYDWSDGRCIEDKTPLRAKSRYAESKLALRDAAFALSEPDGFSVAWTRVFFSFGPFEQQQRLVPDVILALQSGGRAACGDSSLVRDYMYVGDVANAIVAVLDHAFRGDVNIASGRPVSIEKLVNRIAGKLDAVGRIDFGKHPRRAEDPQKITADVSRLRDTIGWTPEYDLDTAISETIAWWQSHGA
jgi:nucleoside-diphosphate-sugar epimerase